MPGVFVAALMASHEFDSGLTASVHTLALALRAGDEGLFISKALCP